jgi:outer membrane lipoprotein-sorting protein
MKLLKLLLSFCLILFSVLAVSAQDLSAKEIIRKADEKFNGEKTSKSLMSMTIVRPTWERSIEFKNWTSGRDYALTLITAPAKDKGQSFLKRHNEMWSWNPTISRLIKLPPLHDVPGLDGFRLYQR